jgi:hypothetical protein
MPLAFRCFRRPSAAERPIGGAGARGPAGHFAAGFAARATGFGASLTVVHLVLATFGAAGVAHLRTQLAHLLRERGAAGHFPHGKRAEVRATAVEFDAAGHHLDVFFVQTGRRTVFARLQALVTCFDAGFVFFVRHDLSWMNFVGRHWRFFPIWDAGWRVRSRPFDNFRI